VDDRRGRDSREQRDAREEDEPLGERFRHRDKCGGRRGYVVGMIDYSDRADGLTEDELTGFFVGWPSPPSPALHLRLLQGSEHVVIARDVDTGHVVGFVTAVGDGVLSAYIPLLEVLPEFQGRGIGTELVRRMLALLEDRYMVDLCCDEELVAFYERLGMARWVGMGLRNRAALD
jgi:ribosomal protein S18 acetylase RimI-like enzyme